MVKFGERIRELASKLGIEEQKLAKDLGLTKSQLSHYINGNRKVPSELLQQIVDTYKINPLFLFRSDEEPFIIKEEKSTYGVRSEYNYIPTAISAGIPLNVEAITNADKITLPDSVMGKYAGHKDVVILRVNGDSMNNIMPDDSLIAIKPITLDNLYNGDIVVYSHNGEYSVKHYNRYGDALVFKPNSTNTKHKEQEYSIDDGITVHGKVVMYIVNLD